MGKLLYIPQHRFNKDYSTSFYTHVEENTLVSIEFSSIISRQCMDITSFQELESHFHNNFALRQFFFSKNINLVNHKNQPYLFQSKLFKLFTIWYQFSRRIKIIIIIIIIIQPSYLKVQVQLKLALKFLFKCF